MMAKKAMAHGAPGAKIIVWADDPLAAVDIPHMCHGEGHAVESVALRDGCHEFVLTIRPGA